MKRIISYLLALVLVFSSFAVAVFATDYPFVKRTYTAQDYATKYILTKEKVKVYDAESNSNYTYTRKFAYDNAYRLVKETQEQRVLSYKYDKNGNVVKHVNKYTGTGGDFERKTVNYVYNSSGLITKITERYADSSADDRTQKDVYTYKNGRLVKHFEQWYIDSDKEGSGYKGTTAYSYDKDGRLSKTKDSNGNVIKFSYDKKGRIAKEVGEYDTTYYKYNKNGDLVKKYRKERASNFVIESHVYKYDENALLVSKHDHYETGTDEVYSYQYDKDGNLIKSVHKGYYNDGMLYTKETTTYTYKKISTPICRTREGICLSAYTYKYDGKQKKPVVTIDGLLPGADYRVTYSNNVQPGKAKVRVDFTDPTMQSVTIAFRIK